MAPFILLDLRVAKIDNLSNMGYTYRPQYGIVVICKCESEQAEIYEKLKELGLTLKVVCV